MWLVGLGVVMLLMNFAGIGPVGAWTWREMWWAMVSPFVLAVAWWTWADASGYTKRRAMARDEAKRAERRERQAQNLGLKPPKAKGKR